MNLLRICLAVCFAIASVSAADARRCPKGYKLDPERNVCVRIPTGSF